MRDIGASTKEFKYLSGEEDTTELPQLESNLSLLKCIQRQTTLSMLAEKKLESLRSGRDLIATISLAMFFFFLVFPQVLTRVFRIEDHVVSVYASESGVKNTLVLVAFLFGVSALLIILTAVAKKEAHREQFIHFLSHEMIDLLYGLFIQDANSVKRDTSKVELLEYLLAMRVYLGDKIPQGELSVRSYEHLREAVAGRDFALSEPVFEEFFELEINQAVSEFEQCISGIKDSNQQDGLIRFAKKKFEGQKQE